jgi:hypothetical protein
MDIPVDEAPALASDGPLTHRQRRQAILAILSFLSGYMHGAVYAAISESIPKAVRARAFALVYALPVAILGGSTQLVVTWILEVTQRPMSIAWYLTGVSLIGLTAMYALKEGAPVKLGLVKPDSLRKPLIESLTFHGRAC